MIGSPSERASMTLFGTLRSKSGEPMYGARNPVQSSARTRACAGFIHPGKFTFGSSAAAFCQSAEDSPVPATIRSQGVWVSARLLAAAAMGLKSKDRVWLPMKQNLALRSSRTPRAAHHSLASIRSASPDSFLGLVKGTTTSRAVRERRANERAHSRKLSVIAETAVASLIARLAVK